MRCGRATARARPGQERRSRQTDEVTEERERRQERERGGGGAESVTVCLSVGERERGRAEGEREERGRSVCTDEKRGNSRQQRHILKGKRIEQYPTIFQGSLLAMGQLSWRFGSSEYEKLATKMGLARSSCRFGFALLPQSLRPSVCCLPAKRSHSCIARSLARSLALSSVDGRLAGCGVRGAGCGAAILRPTWGGLHGATTALSWGVSRSFGGLIRALGGTHYDPKAGRWGRQTWTGV